MLKISKDELIVFYKQKEAIKQYLVSRGRKILQMFDTYFDDRYSRDQILHVSSCDSIDIMLNEDAFYMVEKWSCMGDSGEDYSCEMPLDMLFDDDAVFAFFKKTEKENEKQRKTIVCDVIKQKENDIKRLQEEIKELKAKK